MYMFHTPAHVWIILPSDALGLVNSDSWKQSPLSPRISLFSSHIFVLYVICFCTCSLRCLPWFDAWHVIIKFTVLNQMTQEYTGLHIAHTVTLDPCIASFIYMFTWHAYELMQVFQYSISFHLILTSVMGFAYHNKFFFHVCPFIFVHVASFSCFSILMWIASVILSKFSLNFTGVHSCNTCTFVWCRFSECRVIDSFIFAY